MIRIIATRENLIKVNGQKAGRLIQRGAKNCGHTDIGKQWFAEISFADARSIGPTASRAEALAEISEHIRTVMREG